MVYINPWLAVARRRRLQNDLRSLYVGKKYRECVEELSDYAAEHDDWQANFAIYVTVNADDEIDWLEVQE